MHNNDPRIIGNREELTTIRPVAPLLSLEEAIDRYNAIRRAGFNVKK